MKRFWPVAVVVVILLAGGIFLALKPDHKSGSNQTQFAFKKACSILTEARAKQLLGKDVTPDTSNQNAASGDLDVSSCGYAQQFSSDAPAATVKTALAAEILVRAAKTDDGAQSNQLQFGLHKPATAQDVSGYGDRAYWYPSAAQLFILKHRNQYILSYGPIQGAHSLDQTKQLADLVIDDL